MKFHRSIDPDPYRTQRTIAIACIVVALASAVCGPVLWYYLLTN